MTQQPNILLIMSDQHSRRFMGAAGEPILRTPALDGLAQRGMRFTNGYCNFPLCGPSRMSFMSGRYASDLGITMNNQALASDVPTFAHSFGAAGYETILCGRMHFNGPDQRHGFHRRLISDVLPKIYSRDSQQMQDILGSQLRGTTGPNVEAIRRSGPGHSGYMAYDHAIADCAVNWFDEQPAHREKPFMMVVGTVLPHAPFVAAPEDFDYYDKQIAPDDLPKSDPQSLHPEMQRLQRTAGLEGAAPVSQEDQRRARVAYYGMCTFLDRQIGRVLEALDKSGLAENTIVVYTSDHGEQLGEHGMWWKHTFYEGSAGIPLLIAGPRIPKDTVITQNVSLLDLGPTLLDMTDSPAIPGASGRSFRCLWEGEPQRWPDEVIAENRWPQNHPALHRMIRRGPWKLCHYPGFEPELYNLEEDPGELHNRAADSACAKVRSELMARLTEGWDDKAIARRHQINLQSLPMINAAQLSSDMPEPNKPWLDSPITNDVQITTNIKQ